MRGINVGGKNKVAMRDLVGVFERAGAADVRTYIQSGNVVFGASASAAKSIGADVRAALEREFGVRSPVVVRSTREFGAVLGGVPWEEADGATLHVMFLERRPSAGAAAKLDPGRSAGDRFAVVGREVYLCLPNGVARSKLTNDYFDRTLGTISTGRNWRTVAKLGEMLGVGSRAV